jgi:hypothetical protein
MVNNKQGMLVATTSDVEGRNFGKKLGHLLNKTEIFCLLKGTRLLAAAFINENKRLEHHFNTLIITQY